MADNGPRRPVADSFARRFAPPELYDPKKRREWKLGRTDEDRGPYVIELSLQHIEGLSGSRAALEALLSGLNGEAPPPPPLEVISKTYVRVRLNLREWQGLLSKDETSAESLARDAIATAAAEAQAAREAKDAKEGQKAPKRKKAPAPDTPKRDPSADDVMRYRAIYKLWPDFPVYSHIYKSVATIKSDAALKSFGAGGGGIVWAVIDSGIDGGHSHFDLETGHTLTSIEVRDLHRCFVEGESTSNELGFPYVSPAPGDPDELKIESFPSREAYLAARQQRITQHRELALADAFGHGTHVAGIIAGEAKKGRPVRTLERAERMDAQTGALKRGEFASTAAVPAEAIRGVAPQCRLISLRVLDGNGEGRSSDVIRALDYVRERLNDNPKLLRVHGVNLSVGYEFDAEMFACGQSPICAEVNRLVQSGVVVVAAAGNTGFGTVSASVRPTKVGLSNTINDPGNAESAITVGATHRDSPYTYGVSYFSSKGPTGDGRLKPDLVAPGERITSCGAGKRLEQAILSVANSASAGTAANVGAQRPNDDAAYYMEDSGTSMAAPHVSGAIAAFLSIRREFIGKPLEVKRIFLDTATPLGRERYFEGHGLIDLIRAIQSI